MGNRKESDYCYQVSFGIGQFGANGVLRPDALLRVVTDTADQHVSSFNANNAMLLEEFGVAWVLLSMEIHLIKPIQPNEILTARTWCTGWKHGMYGRDMEITNADGERVIGMGSLWTLLDVNTREISRSEAAQEAMVLLEEPPIYPGKKARFKTRKYELVEVDQRRIYPSMLDASAHVNNSRYGELFYDSLSEEARDRVKEAEHFEFYFHGELREGDKVTLSRYEDQNEAIVTGAKDGQEAFVVRVVYAEKK